MINNLIDKIFNAKPINLGLLLLLMPFLAGIFTAILSLILLLLGYELIVNPFAVALFIIAMVYLLWTWGISVKLNREKLPDLHIRTMWFNVAFCLFAFYCVFIFSVTINIDVFHKRIHLDNWIINAIDILSSLYGLLVFVSYCYMALFTAKIIKSLEDNVEARIADSLNYAVMIWCFPIGIPLLQAKQKNGFNIYEYMKSISPFK